MYPLQYTATLLSEQWGCFSTMPQFCGAMGSGSPSIQSIMLGSSRQRISFSTLSWQWDSFSTLPSTRMDLQRRSGHKDGRAALTTAWEPHGHHHLVYDHMEASQQMEAVSMVGPLARCGVVWCGVVWCGVVWCGVVWCGVAWCGVVWRGVVFCFRRIANAQKKMFRWTSTMQSQCQCVTRLGTPRSE